VRTTTRCWTSTAIGFEADVEAIEEQVIAKAGDFSPGL
jgi:hypothetical protein